MQLIKIASFCLALTLISNVARAQSPILESMFQKSDKVMQVTVNDVTLNHKDPAGLSEWKAASTIKETFKGDEQKGAKMDFFFSRLEYKRDADGEAIVEPLKAEKNKTYIVFITNGQPTDRWLGILPDSPYLHDTLRAFQMRAQRGQQTSAQPQSTSETRY